MNDLTWFTEHFPDEASCQTYLFQCRWPDGFSCPCCGSPNYYWIASRSLYECKECRTQHSLTSGTILHGSKLPLKYWFFVIYWVIADYGVSANRISHSLQLNYRTATRLLRSIRKAMSFHNGYNLFQNMQAAIEAASVSKQQALPEVDANPNSDRTTLPASFGQLSIIHPTPFIKRGFQSEVLSRASKLFFQRVQQYCRKLYKQVSKEYEDYYWNEYYFLCLGRWYSAEHNFSKLFPNLTRPYKLCW